eukprot:4473862-Amphidinium_carterae.1
MEWNVIGNYSSMNYHNTCQLPYAQGKTTSWIYPWYGALRNKLTDSISAWGQNLHKRKLQALNTNHKCPGIVYHW